MKPADFPPAGALDTTATTLLETLAAIDPVQERIVELRFFGGLTIEETAHSLGVSPSTVKREWTVAKAWLYREINRSDD